jgi:C4-dicarboxylate transporter DctM subunit
MLLVLALVLMLALLAVGAHAAVAMGLVTTALILMLDGVPTAVIAQTACKSVNSYPLMAIPMFVLAGNLMTKGDIANVRIDLIGSIVRAVRGGLALTVMIASVFFAAISG